MIEGGKDKYTCLLTLIKYESPKLYELISDLCLDGMFRSQRYVNTFLMPSKEIVEHLQKLVHKDDNDEEAIRIIRSMMLQGVVHVSDLTKGKIITTNYDRHALAKPEELVKLIEESKKKVVYKKRPMKGVQDSKSEEGELVVAHVLQYKGVTPPEIKGGFSGGAILVGSIFSGGSNETQKKVDDITKQMVVSGDAKKTINNFFKGVAGLLNVLEEKGDDHYKRAKYFLSANPILSWYFMTLAGRDDALISSSELNDFEWESVVDPAEIIHKAENSNYSLNKSTMAAIREKRSYISTHGDKTKLIHMIKDAYKQLIEKAIKVDSTDKLFESNLMLKLLMDECRFIYESTIDTWDDVDDILKAMKSINWSMPEKHLSICNQSVQDSLKSPEAFVSGPVLFVRSTNFMYVPLTESVEAQLLGISGGNPATVSSVLFTGGAARKALKSSSSSKLKSMVKMLSKAQREQLKKLL